jgi:hypothetical protein
VQRLLKSALTRIGARCTPGALHRLDATLAYLHVGRWMRDRGFHVGSRSDSREDVFAAIVADVADENVLYLEFGVFEGESMRFWSRALRNPASQLHGFDSFEGLPESWTRSHERGRFSTNGRIPKIDDARVRFFKGWFERTLPAYEPPPHDRLVINVDSDLYSSADIVLRTLEPLIVPGTYLYFDEFHDRHHELRAFDELLDRTNAPFRVVAASRELQHVAFQRIQ